MKIFFLTTIILREGSNVMLIIIRNGRRKNYELYYTISYICIFNENVYIYMKQFPREIIRIFKCSH